MYRILAISFLLLLIALYFSTSLAVSKPVDKLIVLEHENKIHILTEIVDFREVNRRYIRRFGYEAHIDLVESRNKPLYDKAGKRSNTFYVVTVVCKPFRTVYLRVPNETRRREIAVRLDTRPKTKYEMLAVNLWSGVCNRK